MGSPDTLAAAILRAKQRCAQEPREDRRRFLSARIDGMCTAWEHLTEVAATETTLTEAATRTVLDEADSRETPSDYEVRRCVSHGAHLLSSRHTGAECPVEA